MESIIEKMRETAKSLWQGDRVNIGTVVVELNEYVTHMLYNIESESKKGKQFPVEYIENAMINLENAMKNNDVYLIADCMLYEWVEILSVYEEWKDA